MYLKKGGATSQTIEVFIQDSSKTDGSGLTGLVYNSGSLVASYVRPGAARAAITLATQTASGAWSSGGFVEIDATNMPGWYRLDVPDAAIAAGVDHVGIHLKGATNMAPCPVVITLVKFDPQEASLGIGNLVNTGATYNVPNSVFKQIRTSGGGAPTAIRSGTAQTGSTASTIKLDSGASSIDNIYNGNIIVLDGGTGIGQTRTIVGYNGTTKVVTVDSNWVTTPDGTTTFSIYAAANALVSDEGTAQAGASTTITLRSGAASGTDFYKNSFVTIVAGTGSGQTKVITAYNGSTKVATVDSAWSVTPDNTSVYQVIPAGNVSPPATPNVPSASQNAAAVLASSLSTAPAAGTVAEALAVARAQGIGKWTLTGTTLTIYAHDGTTVLATLTLDSATVPTQRA